MTVVCKMLLNLLFLVMYRECVGITRTQAEIDDWYYSNCSK